MKFIAYYRLTVAQVIEADSIEEAMENVYDNVPYPNVEGDVLSADCETASVEEADDDAVRLMIEHGITPDLPEGWRLATPEELKQGFQQFQNDEAGEQSDTIPTDDEDEEVQS